MLVSGSRHYSGSLQCEMSFWSWPHHSIQAVATFVTVLRLRLVMWLTNLPTCSVNPLPSPDATAAC